MGGGEGTKSPSPLNPGEHSPLLLILREAFRPVLGRGNGVLLAENFDKLDWLALTGEATAFSRRRLVFKDDLLAGGGLRTKGRLEGGGRLRSRIKFKRRNQLVG